MLPGELKNELRSFCSSELPCPGDRAEAPCRPPRRESRSPETQPTCSANDVYAGLTKEIEKKRIIKTTKTSFRHRKSNIFIGSGSSPSASW